MNVSKMKQNEKDNWCQLFLVDKYLIKRNKLHGPAVVKMHYNVSLSWVAFCDFSVQSGHECSYRLMVNFGYDLWVDIVYFKVFTC